MTIEISKVQLIHGDDQTEINDFMQALARNKNYHYKIDPQVLEIGGAKNATHFLAKDQGKLISYMVTNFYTRESLEVTMVGVTPETYPEMLRLAKELMLKEQLRKLELIIDTKDRETKDLAEKTNFTYAYSEYRLNLIKNYQPVFNIPALTLRWAAMADIIQLDELDRQGFGETAAPVNPNITNTYVAEINGELIGKIVREQTSQSLGIFGFVVTETQRGKGYGQEILNHLIAAAQKEKLPFIFLEVAATNPAALKLYQRSGFEIFAQFDYYELN